MPNEPTNPGDASRTTALTAAALDRGALDRVLARAAELSAGTLVPSEGMTEGQLVELGQEVGISAEQIRQALAEERTRVAVPEARGLMGELFGAGLVAASRIVPGTPAAVLAQLDQWMQREELLRPMRRFADRLTWEARRGMMENLQTGFNFSGRAYALRSATEVGSTVVAVDPQRCLVRLDANFEDSRRLAAGVGGTIAGLSTAGAVGLVSWAASISGASLAIAGGVAAGWSLTGLGIGAIIARVQRRRVVRAQLALEQILDRLEHGEVRRSSNALVDLLTTITR